MYPPPTGRANPPSTAAYLRGGAVVRRGESHARHGSSPRESRHTLDLARLNSCCCTARVTWAALLRRTECSARLTIDPPVHRRDGVPTPRETRRTFVAPRSSTAEPFHRADRQSAKSVGYPPPGCRGLTTHCYRRAEPGRLLHVRLQYDPHRCVAPVAWPRQPLP